MATVTLKVKRVVVITRRSGTDRISLELDEPTSFPVMKYPAHAEIEAQQGHGVEWCRTVLGREPDEVITFGGSRP